MIKIFVPVIFAVFAFSSCKHDRLKVDVSNISLKLHIDRFEKDLFKSDTTHAKESFDKLGKQYPTFLPLFASNIALPSNSGKTRIEENLSHFISNKDLKSLKKDVDSVYPNLDNEREALEDAFKHYRYYYPKGPLPHVLTFISGFNNAIVNTDTDLGIGLDMFMGSHYKYYASVNFPRYLIKSLNKDHLVPTAVKGFAKQLFSAPPSGASLLSNMLYEGKILYFLDAMMPEAPDTAKIAYSAKQLEWCKTNESNIWAFSVEKDKLFSTDRKIVDNFFSDGPFTQGLNQDSPARLGMFTGWQIIRKYMQENPNISLQALMAEKDEQKILQGSAYKP